jgi:proteasome alpha subunit
MFDEPYRWVEAISNRREYLDEQLKGGSPALALPCREGILLVTVSAGTQKLYEIYDRIALCATGHPADVERLRNILLDMAHVEGFNRSPSDVTARRLIQFGLAPLVKQAFEEISRAPFIIRLLIAELTPSGHRVFFALNYDGVFREQAGGALLAPSEEAGERMMAELKKVGAPEARPMREIFPMALKIWAAGEKPLDHAEEHLRKTLQDKERTVEGGLLSASLPGSSKFRGLTAEEINAATQGWRGPAR